jgi:hypothetical protein
MTTSAERRPVGVTVIAVILFIQAIAGIVGGIAFIIERNNASLLDHVDAKSNEVTAYATVAIVWGVIALLVGMGLWRGGNWARVLVAIVEVLSVAGGVYLLIQWDGTHAYTGIWQIAIGMIVLYLLFNPRASEFFEGHR